MTSEDNVMFSITVLANTVHNQKPCINDAIRSFIEVALYLMIVHQKTKFEFSTVLIKVTDCEAYFNVNTVYICKVLFPN